MAVKKKKDSTYVRKAKTTSIKAVSRCSVKIRDNYYTVEYEEERLLDAMVDATEVDLQKERGLLWDDVNAECDKQIEDILRTFKK